MLVKHFHKLIDFLLLVVGLDGALQHVQDEDGVSECGIHPNFTVEADVDAELELLAKFWQHVWVFWEEASTKADGEVAYHASVKLTEKGFAGVPGLFAEGGDAGQLYFLESVAAQNTTVDESSFF